MDKSVWCPALRIAGIYVVAGILWIVVSDKILGLAAPDVPQMLRISMYKGWFFVLASGLLIYMLLRRELTARFQVESALRTSEGKLFTALDMAHLGHWELDFIKDEFTFNDHFYKIFRTSVDEVGSYTMSSAEYARRFVYPDDAPLVAEEIRKSLDTTDPAFTSRLEHRMLYADGEVGYISVQYFVVKDEQGRTVKTFGVNQDVTERKRAMEAARQSAERYRSLFEHMIEGFAWCKMIFENGQPRDFVYVDVNESFGKLTGLHDVIGKRVTEVIPGIRESDPELFEIYGRVSLTGKAEKFETYVDAMGIWFSLSVYCPEPEHFIAVFDNITARKEAEEALRQSEERNRFLAGILDFSSQPFASGGADGTLDVFNKAFCDLVGYSEEEMSSVNWVTDLTPPEYREMEADKVEQLLRTGEPVRYEKEFRRKNGSRVSVELLAHVAKDESGKPLYLYAFITDLTARKQAEDALRRSEEELRLTLEATSDGIWKWNFATNEMVVSDTWYTMLGYEPQAFPATYESWLALMHPEDVARTREMTEKFAASHSDFYEHEFRLRTKDNQYKWVRSRARVVQKDEHGKPLRLIGNHQDITERKLSEEHLRQERDKLKGILDVFNDGVCIINDRYEIEYINPVMEATFGPVRDRKCHEYLQGQAEPCPVCHNLEVIAGRTVQREFVTARVGKTFDIFETPIRNDEGALSKLVFFHDITERKRAEEDRIRLATAIEQASETVVITDADGTIQYVNPAFERTTGYSRDEAIGNNPRILKSGHHDDRFYKYLWETIAKGEVWNGHFITKKKDGSLFEEEATISPIKDDSGKIVNYVAVKRDVTREVSLQQQLLQAQKMEAVGTLAGGVAHDFNNLLQVTLGYAELLLHDKQEDDPERKDLQKIFHAAKSGSELVRSLLTFSRKVEPKFIALSLNRQIVRIETLLRRTIPRMIDIQLLLDEDLKEVLADPIQMEQVLMNLAVNAQDAMPDGGILTIETKNVSVDDASCGPRLGSMSGECVLLTVSDSGQGMDPETLEHIFEPFFTTKELGRGTGLGLAVVYGIVQQHGGDIACESTVGHGTTFSVYLPAIEPQEVLEGDTILLPAFGTETILLVDDEEAVRELGKRILVRAGYTVLTAENGQEALDLFKAEHESIALVVLDLIMPRMGGKDCLKELVQLDPQVKVLIASGFVADTAPRDYIGLGAKGFVSKPFRLRELLDRVRKALDKS